MSEPARENLWQVTFAELSRRILSGEYAAGTKFPPERDLAPSLGTNRNTLREAVRRLEEAGYVTVKHGVGVTVRDVRRSGSISLLGPFLEHAPNLVEKAQVVLDLLPSRARVLSLMVRYAAERSTEADWSLLTKLRRETAMGVADKDGPKAGAAFALWLDALVDAAHSIPTRWIANPFLSAETEVRKTYPNLYEPDPAIVVYLDALHAALKARDPDTAESLTAAFFHRVDARVIELASALVASAV